ncbi:MAG: EAL domain-containing protein [Candidatus Acidiferrum sp.]
MIKTLSSRRAYLGFVCAIVTLLAVGAFSFLAFSSAGESERWVRHTHEVLENLQELLVDIRTVEASSRGFILVGNDSYLTYFKSSEDRARLVAAHIASLTVDNPRQQRQLPALQALISREFLVAEEGIELTRKNGREAGRALVQSGEGQHATEELQTLIYNMRDEELRLLALRQGSASNRSVQAKSVVVVGSLLGLLMATAAGWIFLRQDGARARAESTLAEEEERFRTMANNISQLAWMADEKGFIFWYNQRWFDYSGTNLEEMAGWGWQKVHHPDHVQGVVDSITKSFESGQPWDDTFPLRGRDGVYRWFLSRAVPIRDAQGKILRWFGTNTDISDRIASEEYLAKTVDELTRANEERRIVEEALFEEKERAQVTLDSIGDAVACTDMAGNITFLNAVAEKMTGWARQEAAGRPMTEILQIRDGDTREVIPNPMEMAVALNRCVSVPPNCILIRRDGQEIPIEDSVAPIHSREGQAAGAVIVFRDMSATRAMTLQMTHSAQHDFLTGLPNRMLLNDRIDRAVALAPRHNKKVGVLFLDLDGFKHINDSLGHAIGDKLLQSVAKRLVGCVRGADTVSRLGGDEFLVLLSEMANAEDAAITALRMLQAVAEVHPVDHHELHVTASIGVSVHPDDGLDAEALIKNADIAMYQAKEHGRQGYQFFKPAMNVKAVERQSIEEGLRRALERQEFSLVYQPKIHLQSGEVTGAEALLRWTHPTRGSVSPAQFIPVAEDCGLILPIGNWVLRTACAQARTWLAAGLSPGTIAVNISAAEFRNEDFLAGVFAILEQTGLAPAMLELELTESVLMRHATSAENILKTLRARGVRVAVDDFGTGYSSLSYLRKFSIDALKIDQSFVRQITNSPGERTIVTAIISMAQNLNLSVVAEGVETAEELSFLKGHNCNEAQGYYFSRPLPASEFASFLQNRWTEALVQVGQHAEVAPDSKYCL